MKRKLEMDDVRKGMYITVLKGEMVDRIISTPNGHKKHSTERNSNNGSVMEVIGLDLPYIAVTKYEAHFTNGSINRVLDLRRIQVMQLSMEFVNKLFPDLDTSENRFWEGIEDTSLEDADTTIAEIFRDL